MTTNLTRAQARSRPELLSVELYTVDLDLTAATDPDAETFASTTIVDLDAVRDGETFIDLIADSVSSVTINNEPLNPRTAFDGARVHFPVTAGANRLEITAACLYSRSGEGLHRYFDPADDKVYLYTQYEPTDARRVFANFDQPDLKARFQFTVTAPKDFSVLSNSPIASVSAPVQGLLRHEFAVTGVQSSYITCVTAGHYATATDTYTHPQTGQTIELGVHTRASLAEHMDAESIFTVTKQGLDFFHEHFDYPYPWGKYDQIFVPEYNLGAMENPGLVTFTDSLIFRDKVTRASYEARANVILHEMAHMWFGDLVTMAWWDDLWLKESFADYMGGLALAKATEFDDGWVTFALQRKGWAYRQDQYPTTHPIVADIPDVEAAKLNFDGITYAKGASVLKQLVAYVGQDAFMAGTRQYFRAHEFGTATLTDFLAALEAAAPDRDLAAWADAWLKTTGVSELSLEIATDDDGTITAAEVVQQNSGTGASGTGEAGPEAVRPHRFQLAGFLRKGNVLTRTQTWEIDFDTARAEVPDLVGVKRPDLLLLNYGDDDFVKVRLDEVSTETALKHVSRFADPMDRALVWSALTNAMRDGLLPATDFLTAYSRSLSRETHAGISATLMRTMLTALDAWLPDRYLNPALDGLLGVCFDALAASKPGSDEQLALARTLLSLVLRSAKVSVASPPVRAGRELAQAMVAVETGSDMSPDFPGLTIDHALRWHALTALATLGWADVSDIDEALAADQTGSGRLHALTAEAARPLPIAKQRAFTAATSDESLSNDVISARIAGFTVSSGLPITEPFVEEYFRLLEGFWERSIEIARRLVNELYPSWSIRPDEVLAMTDEWLEAHADAPAAQRRLLIELRDDLARSIRLRAAGGDTAGKH